MQEKHKTSKGKSNRKLKRNMKLRSTASVGTQRTHKDRGTDTGTQETQMNQQRARGKHRLKYTGMDKSVTCQ